MSNTLVRGLEEGTADAPSRAHRGRVRKAPHTANADAGRGRVWKSAPPSARLRRIGAFAAVATLGLMTAGAFALSELDDGPTVERIDPAELPAGAMYHLVDQVGARALWEQGITGTGVNVALIDTGVAPVAELADQVVAAVDLSADARVPSQVHVDQNGHGTHLAGIIAGRTPGATPGTSAERPDQFFGVAPDAGIVSVKVAGRDGVTSPATVIAGIEWVVANADQLDIGVLTLAYDASGADANTRAALAAAVERAWDAGIVVVVAAGNSGPDAEALAAPADNPFVIAVGGVEPTATGFAPAEFSSRGDGVRNPDLAAPGASVRSLRAPGSDADLEHPEGHVDEQLFLGSGSSQSAAVVAGVAALLLDADSSLSPDQVKAALTASAVPSGDAELVGAGVVSAPAALAADTTGAEQTWERTIAPQLPMPATTGVMTVRLDPTSSTWTSSTWTSSTWTSSTWTSSTWTSSTWTSSTWTSSTWTSSTWTSSTWTSSTWTSSTWTSSTWTSSTWT